MKLIYTHAIAAGVAAAIGAGAAWWAQDARYTARIATIRTDHAAVLQGIADKTAKAAQTVRAREAHIRAQLADTDYHHHEELTSAREETDRLRTCVRNGTCGVRVVARSAHACPGTTDASASDVGDAGIALDPAAGQRVLDLRESVHADAAKLAYLRAYALQCWQATGQVAPSD